MLVFRRGKMANGQLPVAFECRRCWAILPYLECPHNCPGADIDEEDEAFGEDLLGFKEEIKESGYLLDEAPPPQIVELIADPPVEVVSIQAFQVSPGVFRPISEVLAEAQQQQQQQMQQ